MLIKKQNLAFMFILINSVALSNTKKTGLNIREYNSQCDGLSPVTSTILYAGNEAILFDAQFTVNNSKNLVKILKENKTTSLTTIVITSSDPDFYFGLDPVVKAFPNAKLIASPKVAQTIVESNFLETKYWREHLGNQMPKEIYTPQATDKGNFTFGDVTIQLRMPDSYVEYYYIPQYDTILGGPNVYWGVHLYLVDSSYYMRNTWREALNDMISLNPKVVIPAHYLGSKPSQDQAVKFTLQYLQTFDKLLLKYKFKNATAVFKKMLNKYPNLGMENWLKHSVQSITGEKIH